MSDDASIDRKLQEAGRRIEARKQSVPKMRKDPEPATPAAERDVAGRAKPTNDVHAQDPFGAPRGEPEWTRESITTQTVMPSYGGPDDRVAEEQADELKE